MLFGLQQQNLIHFMKTKFYLLALIVVTLFTSVSMHKYYVSITEIEFVKEKQSVQVITRLFIDDFQRLLRERYDDKITLEEAEDESDIDVLIEKYIKNRLKVSINSEEKTPVFIGKEYDQDIVYCYYEIENISEVKTMEIKNTVLFDIFGEQKNVVRTNINGKNKTFVLIPENDKGLLNFN